MAKYVDSFSNDDRLDLSGLHCPMKRCGSSNVKVLRYPRAGSWMKAIGSARCEDCGAQFPLREVPPPEPAPPEETFDW
jgi:hypothetical protein